MFSRLTQIENDNIYMETEVNRQGCLWLGAMGPEAQPLEG